MKRALLLFPLALLAFASILHAQDPGANKPSEKDELQEQDPAVSKPAAKDAAAVLFYRAFWLEQAGQRNADAEKMYRKLIADHPEAPEAPRAYLALIRIRAANGVAAEDMLKALEKGYPKAKKEIELAKKLAARLRTDFDPKPKADDTPVVRKIKTIYTQLRGGGGVSSEDWDFLSDIGPAGHPMLALLLRSQIGAPVKNAATALANQKSAEANAVIEAALRNPAILHRMVIIDVLRSRYSMARSTMKTLMDIWPRASRSMRRRIASTWINGTLAQSPSRADCYEYLAVALADKDADVRVAAARLRNPTSHEVRPASYVRALLPLYARNDRAVRELWKILPWQLAHAELAADISKILVKHDGHLVYTSFSSTDYERVPEPVANAMAKMVIERGRRDPKTVDRGRGTPNFATLAASSSGKAARVLLEDTLRGGRDAFGWAVAHGFKRREHPKAPLESFMSGAVDLRARALKQTYSDDPVKRSAAVSVLHALPLGVKDFDAVVAAAKANPGKGISAAALRSSYIAAIGPERTAVLVSLARDDQVLTIARMAQAWLRQRGAARPDRGLAAWRALISRFNTPDGHSMLFKLPKESTELADAVGEFLLGAHGDLLLWTYPDATVKPAAYRYGPKLLRSQEMREAFGRQPLRKRLYEAADDRRQEIGKLAMLIANSDPTPARLTAYKKALDSPWWDVRREALKRLAASGEKEGDALIVSYLQREGVTGQDRIAALRALCMYPSKPQLPYIKSQLDLRPDGEEANLLWGAAFELERVATTDRALKEVFGEGPDDFRASALGVLTEVSDARRIPIFRKVLREDKDSDRVHRVLRTVADQYLIELGPEVLIHLRSPNAGIRQTATKAIERLKFYAEAKKLFDADRENK
ncbi:MAG: tetratricopeptide repeat protein [Planctomycetota bacterium]|jgi:hypothetical protein